MEQAMNETKPDGEGVRVEGTVMQRAPCPAIVGSKRIGGTDARPTMAVYFCQLDEGHDGEHSAVKMLTGIHALL